MNALAKFGGINRPESETVSRYPSILPFGFIVSLQSNFR